MTVRHVRATSLGCVFLACFCIPSAAFRPAPLGSLPCRSESQHRLKIPSFDDSYSLSSPKQKVSSVLRTSAKDLLERIRGGGQESPSFSRQLLAETLGTFILVQFGTASVLCSLVEPSMGLFAIASCWTVAVILAISVSSIAAPGPALNPAISLTSFLLNAEKIRQWIVKLPCLIFAQVLGAVLGSGVNVLLYGKKLQALEAASGIVRSSEAAIATAKGFGEYYSVPWKTAFLAEALGTGILSFVVFSLTHPNRENSRIPPEVLIGATVGLLIVAIAPLTQAGFNPARDFGPRIVAWLAGWKGVAFHGWWLYVLAPMVGAPLGGILGHRLAAGNNRSPSL